MANSRIGPALSLALVLGAGCAAHEPPAASEEQRAEARAAPTEMAVTLRSFNYPDRGVRVEPTFMVALAPVAEGDPDFAAFRVVPGLDGSPGSVSFESVQVPGAYLRHQDLQLKLHPHVDAPRYLKDASFVRRPGLAVRHGVSFESVNYPGHYIRHRGFMLYLDPLADGEVYSADATFLVVPAG